MIALYLGLAAVIFLGDCWLKNLIERSLKVGETREAWGGRLLIRRTHNRGAFMNLGQNRSGLVTGLAVAMTVLVTVMFLLSLGQKGNHLLRMGLALLLGGAFSNTYDHLKRKYVVDYFSFGVKWKKLRRIVFNLSDFCIIIGALAAALGTQME